MTVEEEKTAQMKIADTIIEKAVEGIAEIDFTFEDIEIRDISEEVSAFVKTILQEEEVKTILREKVIETIKHIDPKAAAKQLSLSWGDLLGSFLMKIKNAIFESDAE